MKLWVAVAALAAAPWPAGAQGGAAALDSVFNRIAADSAAPAIGIAVVHRGVVAYLRTGGWADLERLAPANDTTRFDWASIAKQFTAYAVSLLVEAGRLAPSDPARRYVPELDLDGAAVTIAHLIHHTSGLDDADGLAALAGWKAGDALLTEDLVPLLTRQRYLRFPPGEAHAYSNGGYVLLAEIVARLAGSSFATWTDSAVFRPLGLRHAGFPDSPGAVVPGRALPYLRSGTGVRGSEVDTYAGAGGLYATVGDMARWAAHVLDPKTDRAATLRLRERGRLNSGDSLGYAWGLAWSTYRGVPTLQHAGSGPATDAMLLMFPEHDLAIVAAAAGPHDPTPAALAYRAADAWLAGSLGPRDTAPAGRRMIMITEAAYSTRPAESEGVTVDPTTLDRLAGIYRFPGGNAMVVRRRGAQLEFGYDGRPPYIPLFPLPDGRFVHVPLWDVYRFVDGPDGAVREMRREAVPRSLRRGDPASAVGERVGAPRYDRASAAPYLGWYVNDELRAVYEVALEGETLVLRHARHGSMPLIPLGDDRFGIGAGRVIGATFARPPDGPAVGLELEARSWGVRASFRRLAPPGH
jgi:CubicO group peptidase (beta-lactamase class C family)